MLPKNSVSLAVEKKQVTSKEKSVKAEKDIKPE